MKEFKRKEKINKVKRDRVEDENDRRESKAKEEFEKRQTALTKRLKPAVQAIYSEEKAAELALENQADVTPEVKKAWTQLHCSHSITIEMMGVVRVGDVQGAKYMNDQAEAAFGEGELGVRCPPASAIPAPYGMDVLRSEGPVARMQRDLRAQAFNRALEIEKIRKEREHLWEKLRKDLGSEELEDATKHLIAVHVKELRKEKEEGKKPEAKPEPAETAPIPEEKTEEKTEESAEEKAKEEAEQKKKKSRQAMIKALAALQFAEEEAQKEVDSLSEASQNAFENPVKD